MVIFFFLGKINPSGHDLEENPPLNIFAACNIRALQNDEFFRLGARFPD